MSKPSSYTRARRVTIEDGNDQPLTSEIDGQRFRVDRGDTSTVDGAPVLTIDNEDVALRNAGRLTTQGDTATVEVNGEDARIDNRFGGSIEAEDTAIEVNGEDARIDNRFGGSIEAEDTAIEVNGEDARIANRFGGSIEAGDTAVQVNDEDARIVNSGTIAGGFNGISFAAEGADSGLIVNRGVITSDSRAVDIDGEDVTLINRGSILGTGDQRDGTVYADNTADDYVIRNAGSIDAGDGNQGAGISLSLGAEVDAEVVNSGIVQGRGDAAASSPLAGDGIRLSSGVDGPSTFTGDITNRGVISSEGANGTVAGIRVANGVGFEGTLTNARDGLVSGVQNGVYFGNADHDGGEFVNRGTVTSDSRAVNLDGDDLTFENRGEVLGTGNQRNGTTYIDGTGDDITVENRGTIDAGEGNTGDGLSVQVGSAAEDATNEDIDIRNSGSILGRGQAEFEGGRLTPNGSSGVRFFNGSGQPEATVTGSVVNAGTISAEVDVGFLGGLVVEDGVAFDGHIVNERGGLIAGPRNGLYIGNASHDLTIENEGRIESGSRAVNLDGDNVTFRNEGTVVGTGDQRNGTVYADATAENFVVDNLRRGLIDAGEGNDGAGVSLQIGDETGDVVEGELNNYGTIVGRGDGIGNLAGDGIRLFSGVEGGPTTFEGNVTNRGRVVSSDDGIEINPGLTLDGDIVNRGRVDAGEDAIDLDTDATLDGDIVNTGVFKADDDGVDLILGATVTGDIVNDGRIEADDDGLLIGAESVVGGTILNRGTITGDADGDGNGRAIDAEFANTDLTVVNEGRLNGDVVLGSGNDRFDGSDGEIRGGVFGGAGNDELIGGDGDEVLVGGGGGDTLIGGDGDDFLQGGGGSDITDGGDGDDTASFADIGVGVVANLSDEDVLDQTGQVVEQGQAVYFPGGPDGPRIVDTLISIENLLGSANDDILVGGDETNTVNGGGGNDRLVGNGGSDTFVFEQGTGQDLVEDFDASSSLLDLSDFGFEDVALVQEAAEDVEIDGQVATVIDLDGAAGADQVTLLGVAVADLNDGNVVLSDDANA